ncbi:PEP-CTERM sorting domain-containing protein [Aquabacterium sp. NJ1]|uniref:beta strand repeat-containing protein n=1 Tax=Aquabacterium sp. NJ1 TaxID=1538295 RepID=UPI001269F339|nr:PEP-CTERM sorting domain-containing protein [Aquabacterium sp. NJ1]
MKPFAPVLSHASRLYASIGLVSALGLGMSVHASAQAAVVYLPPCFSCALGSTPPEGDEWVIQGIFVRVGKDGLSSQGALTNNASYFSNAYGFETSARLTNNKSFTNTGTLHILSATAATSLDNLGTLTNTGQIQADAPVNNMAGARLTNNGVFEGHYVAITNSGSLVNNGSFRLTSGKLTNGLGGTLDNRADLQALANASISNQGTLRNRSGATLSTSGVLNTGTIVNEAGGLIKAGSSFNNVSGSTLINHGTITASDSVFMLAQGSNYDFTGGTFINSSAQGRLVLNRDFAFGEAKAGAVKLEQGSTLRNYANLKVIAGYTQANDGDLNNYAGGVLDVRGTLNSANLYNTGTLNNAGVLEVREILTNGAALTNSGTLRASTGQMINFSGATLTNKGTVDVAASGMLQNEGTLLNQGKIAVAGTFVNNGVVQGTGSLQQTAGQVAINGSMTVATASIQGGQLAVQSGGALNAAKVTIGANGDMLAQAGAVSVSSKLTVQGHYGSEGGSNTFKDFVVGGTGWVTAGADTFTVSGNFLNASLQSTAWHTDEASLHLTGSGTQQLALAGADLGATRSAYQNNFAWSELVLGSASQYVLTDGNNLSGGALYVGHIQLEGGLSQLASINSPFNVYYDPTVAGNEYLGGQTYAFGTGGGHLMAVSAPALPQAMAMNIAGGPTAVPEPSAVLLTVSGAMVLLWARKRKVGKA